MSRRVSRRRVDDGPTTVRSARQGRSWTRMPGLTLRSRVGALFATEPQWPRINRSWAAVWERVIRASSVNQRPHRADYGNAARVTTPLALASDTGGFASAQARRQAFACHRPCIHDHWHTFGAGSPDHRGPQAPRTARSRPWRRERRASLCRGRQGLWTLWTAEREQGTASSGRRAVITVQ